MNASGKILSHSLILAFWGLACNAPENETAKQTPPYATTQSLDTPRIFGKGIISTFLPEFATSFTPTGETVYFNTINEDRSILRIVKSTFINGEMVETRSQPHSPTGRIVMWIPLSLTVARDSILTRIASGHEG